MKKPTSHRKRGPKRFSYTYKDVASRIGKTAGTLKSYQSSGRFDSSDLINVALAIARYQARKNQPVSEDKRQSWLIPLSKDALAQWENRWPRFELYACPGCSGPVLARGLCRQCGGAELIDMDSSGYFRVCAGTTYIPLHRIIAQAPSKTEDGERLHVHHRDGNRWNNQVDNLVVLTASDHRTTHECNKKRLPPEVVTVPYLLLALLLRVPRAWLRLCDVRGRFYDRADVFMLLASEKEARRRIKAYCLWLRRRLAKHNRPYWEAAASDLAEFIGIPATYFPKPPTIEEVMRCFLEHRLDTEALKEQCPF